jgi:hypothetical protein
LLEHFTTTWYSAGSFPTPSRRRNSRNDSGREKYSAAPFVPTTTVFPLPDAEKRQTEQRTLGQKSPFGKFEEVPDAGSYLQYWSPDVVTAAVKKVLTDKG